MQIDTLSSPFSYRLTISICHITHKHHPIVIGTQFIQPQISYSLIDSSQLASASPHSNYSTFSKCVFLLLAFVLRKIFFFFAQRQTCSSNWKTIMLSYAAICLARIFILTFNICINSYRPIIITIH